MATRPSPLEYKDSFLAEVETVRVSLKELVSEVRASLQQREEELCAELDRLETEHRNRASEHIDKLNSLTSIQAGIEEQFKSGEFEDLKKSILSETNKKIEELEREYPPHSVELAWEGGLTEKVKRFGKIVVSVGKSIRKCQIKQIVADNEIVIDTDPEENTKALNVAVKTSELVDDCVEKPLAIGVDDEVNDYKLRTKPVSTFGDAQFPNCYYPQGIAYDKKDNSVYFTSINTSLYKMALGNNQVLTGNIPNHRILDKYNPNLRNPRQPNNVNYFIKSHGIAILNNNICISGTTVLFNRSLSVVLSCSILQQQSHYIQFNESYTHTFSFGKHGSAEGELNSPTGIAFDTDLLYVCDSKNYRVSIYFVSGSWPSRIIGTITDPDMYLPLDVKVHDRRIFILNSKPPYVLEFDHTGFRRDTFLSNYILSDFLPSFLCIDREGRFLISDKRQPYVYVFRREKNMSAAVEARLELEHGEDPLVEPRGVCLDGEGRVIVLCNYRQALLQIF